MYEGEEPPEEPWNPGYVSADSKQVPHSRVYKVSRFGGLYEEGEDLPFDVDDARLTSLKTSLRKPVQSVYKKASVTSINEELEEERRSANKSRSHHLRRNGNNSTDGKVQEEPSFSPKPRQLAAVRRYGWAISAQRFVVVVVVFVGAVEWLRAAPERPSAEESQWSGRSPREAVQRSSSSSSSSRRRSANEGSCQLGPSKERSAAQQSEACREEASGNSRRRDPQVVSPRRASGRLGSSAAKGPRRGSGSLRSPPSKPARTRRHSDTADRCHGRTRWSSSPAGCNTVVPHLPRRPPWRASEGVPVQGRQGKPWERPAHGHGAAWWRRRRRRR